MKIAITIEVYPEYADEDHEVGITDSAYEKVHDSLSWLGEDISVGHDPGLDLP